MPFDPSRGAIGNNNYSNNYSPQGMNDGAKKKGPFMIIAIVVVLLMGVAVGGVMISKASKSKSSNPVGEQPQKEMVEIEIYR